MDPLPLVTFALRIPSRMASSLNSPPLHSAADMVINILSANQAHIATAFSRPDLHPHPFSTTPYILSQEGYLSSRDPSVQSRANWFQRVCPSRHSLSSAAHRCL
ncbi:hypothetical protein B0H10DRAFT_987053 [Mycena sp. CBHHK59/15]|nr:hypothetical protein B0H10DRAFT_987053 [Mycena sp. CBHHK59/15]